MTAPVSPLKAGKETPNSRASDETMAASLMGFSTPTKPISQQKRADKQNEKFIIEVLNKIKHQQSELEDEQNVQLYQKLLLQEIDRKTKKRRKKKANQNIEALETEGSEKAQAPKPVPSPHDTLMEKARIKHEQKCRDELEQPYIFRDKNLVIAENILIFDDFYTKAMNKLSCFALSISMVHQSMTETTKTLDHFMYSAALQPQGFADASFDVSRDITAVGHPTAMLPTQ